MNNKIEMKMKKNQLTMLVLFVTMLGFTACSDDDKVSISTVGITTTVDTPLILAYHTTVANGRPIIHAKEFLTDTARTYLTAEDSLIGLP